MADLKRKVLIDLQTEGGATSIKDLRKEIKALKDELLNLTEGTDEYNKVLLEVANKQKYLTELNDTIRNSSADLGDLFKNTTQTVRGLTGGYEVLQGVLALTGTENEALMETFVKLQAVMAITQGLEGLEGITKSIPRLINNVKALVLSLGAVKTVLAGLGLGALIALLTLVAKNWGKITEALNPNIRKMRELNEENERLISNIEKQNKLNQDNNELMNLLGATQTEVIQKNIENNEKQAVSLHKVVTNAWEVYQLAIKQGQKDEEIQKKKEAYMKALENYNENEKKISYDYIKLNNAKAESEKEFFEKQQELNKKREEDNKKQIEDNKKLAADKKAIMKEVDNYGKDQWDLEIERINEKYETELSKYKFTEEEKIKLKEYYTDLENKIKEDQQAYYDQISQDAADRQNQADEADLENRQIVFEMREELDAENFEIQRERLMAEQQSLLEDHAFTEEQKATIKEYYTKKIDDLDKWKSNMERERLNQGLEFTSSILNSASQLAKKNSKTAKALAVASTIIDTYVGASKAFSAMAGITVVGPVLGAIAAAAAIAAGLVRVKNILSVKEEGESGGGSISGGGQTNTVSVASVSSQMPNMALLNSNQNTALSQTTATKDLQKDTKVYVVESEINDKSKKRVAVEEQAEF